MIMAMFPLGSVLFPHLPLAVRVFEERYLKMLSVILHDEPSQFGVVLIERGSEVGGGDGRFGIGTVARIEQVGTAGEAVAVVSVGAQRIRVDEWIDGGDYPQAEIAELDELEWKDEYRPLLSQAESVVRRTLARVGEFVEVAWSPDVEIDADPVIASWQLAGISPLSEIDQYALLRSTSIPQLLTRLIDLTVDAGDSLTATWGDEEGPPPEKP